VLQHLQHTMSLYNIPEYNCETHSMTSFATLNDALASAEGQKNILIGNGLSIAYNSSFSYAKLFDAARFEENNPTISKVFDALGTKDFETVPRALSSASEIASKFGEHPFSDVLNAQIENLKNDLINAVQTTHPDNRNCLDLAQCFNLQRFLLPFIESRGSVFSLNYDSLLYWAILRKDERRDSPLKGLFADGFGDPQDGNVRFLSDACPQPVNIIFPHGCLFIFEDGGSVLKPQAAMREAPLLEIIRTNMETGKFPLFVSEGTADQKLKAMMKNHYLSYALNRLSTQKECFFVFGHKMDLESDGHILRSIAKNPDVTDIYASYFESEDGVVANLFKLRDAVRRNERDLRLHTYPAASATCW